jgi:hypothetical protein
MTHSLCNTCISNSGDSCNWDHNAYPSTFRCVNHIPRRTDITPPALVLVGVDIPKKEPAPPAPTEFEAFSKSEPAKCVFYAKLP